MSSDSVEYLKDFLFFSKVIIISTSNVKWHIQAETAIVNSFIQFTASPRKQKLKSVTFNLITKTLDYSTDTTVCLTGFRYHR